MDILLENKNTALNSLYANNLKKSFRSRSVVNNVSFNVCSNEIIGLFGPNGAGKTTSFYMVVGLIKSDSGNIILNNINITDYSIHNRARIGLGYLPQESSVFRQMTVAENVLAILELQNYSSKKRKTELYRLLKSLNIDHLENIIATALSGGERRRCEIARLLASNPKFILFDEPFAGVDPIAIADIQEVIIMLKKSGLGIIITDHNVRETLKICDRAYIINEGNILSSGTPDELINDIKVREVYFGDLFAK